MLPTRYTLADVDGTLCVVCRTPNWNEPTVDSMYWPTTTRTRDFLSHFELTEDRLADLTVGKSRPGEYWIRSPHSYGIAGLHVELIDGGRTQPVKRDSTPAPRPKTRCKVEYDSGRWQKFTARGIETIDVQV